MPDCPYGSEAKPGLGNYPVWIRYRDIDLHPSPWAGFSGGRLQIDTTAIANDLALGNTAYGTLYGLEVGSVFCSSPPPTSFPAATGQYAYLQIFLENRCKEIWNEICQCSLPPAFRNPCKEYGGRGQCHVQYDVTLTCHFTYTATGQPHTGFPPTFSTSTRVYGRVQKVLIEKRYPYPDSPNSEGYNVVVYCGTLFNPDANDRVVFGGGCCWDKGTVTIHTDSITVIRADGQLDNCCDPLQPPPPRYDTGSDDEVFRDDDQGDDGVTIIFLPGTPGPKGDKGDRGEPGRDGITGSDDIQGGKGDRGEKGEKGDKGDPGSQGSQGSQGIPGTSGIRGEQGEQGIQGPPGQSKIIATELQFLTEGESPFFLVSEDDEYIYLTLGLTMTSDLSKRIYEILGGDDWEFDDDNKLVTPLSIKDTTDRLYTVVGCESFPAKVPATLTGDSNDQITLNNAAEWQEWLVKQLDSLHGAYPITIKHRDADNVEKILTFENSAEVNAEMLGMLISLNADTDLLQDLNMKIVVEAIATRMTALQAYDYAKANSEFLGYHYNQTSDDVEIPITPSATNLKEFLKESTRKVSRFRWRDGDTLIEIARQLLLGVSIIKGAFFRPLNLFGNDLPGDRINADKTSSNAEGDQNWRDFMLKLETPPTGYNPPAAPKPDLDNVSDGSTGNSNPSTGN